MALGRLGRGGHLLKSDFVLLVWQKILFEKFWRVMVKLCPMGSHYLVFSSSFQYNMILAEG